jgi:hypothetical protein
MVDLRTRGHIAALAVQSVEHRAASCRHTSWTADDPNPWQPSSTANRQTTHSTTEMGRRIWVCRTLSCRSQLILVSPVYSLMLGTKTMIVLSSDEAVKDLLDRRSGNYSDRPDMYIGQEIASGGLRLVVMVSRPKASRVIIG